MFRWIKAHLFVVSGAAILVAYVIWLWIAHKPVSARKKQTIDLGSKDVTYTIKDSTNYLDPHVDVVESVTYTQGSHPHVTQWVQLDTKHKQRDIIGPVPAKNDYSYLEGVSLYDARDAVNADVPEGRVLEAPPTSA